MQLYMVMGGIPQYLKYVKRGLSAAQNINQICFDLNGPLFDEFKNIFASLFDEPQAYLELVRLIAGSSQGLSREVLVAKSSTHTSGGRLTKRLQEMEQAGFISSFIPYGYKERGTFYKVIDEYALFYLSWIEPLIKYHKQAQKGIRYWENLVQAPKYKSWAGYAFEAVCFKHVSEIKRALGIESIAAEVATWRATSVNRNLRQGAQVDLLFDRSDGVINLCEIKYYNKAFSVDRSYAITLKNKIAIFKEHTKTHKDILLTFITLYKVQSNQYAEELVTNQVILDDLYI